MKITFISLFPNYFDSFKNHSIIKRAIEKKIVKIEIINPRNFSTNKKVDDYVIGGGAGMLLMIEPIVKAIESIKNNDSHVIFVNPRGETLKQKKSIQLTKKNHLIFICGHYEGVDSRIKYFIDEEISIGDYILSSGEISATIIADSIIRLLPNVIKNESHLNESFSDEILLEHDHFTKPNNFRNYNVPNVLLTGNHNDIRKYRRQNSIDRTIENILKKRNDKYGN